MKPATPVLPSPAVLRVLTALLRASDAVAPHLPTYRQVMREAGLATPSAVAYHLPALEAAGYVARPPAGCSGLALTPAGRRAARAAARRQWGSVGH